MYVCIYNKKIIKYIQFITYCLPIIRENIYICKVNKKPLTWNWMYEIILKNIYNNNYNTI